MAGPGTLDLNAAPGGTLALGGTGAPPAGSPGGLDFTGPPDGVLAFGAGPGPGTPDEYTVAIDADVGALDASITAYSGRAVAVDADIGALDTDIALRWDANVSRGPRHLARSVWQDAAGAARAIAHRWQGSTPIIVPAAAHWQDGARAATGVAAHWQGSTPIIVARAAHWQDATPRRAAAAIHWQGSTGRRASLAAHWQDPTGVRHQARVHYQEMQRLRHAAAPRWQDPARARRLLREVLLDAIPARRLARTHWQDARRPPPGRSWHELPVQPPHLCYDPAELGVLDFGVDDGTGLGVLAFWCKGDTLPPGAIVVPIRHVYIVTNDISLIRVDGSVPLPAYTFALSLDADSWTWQWSASLHASALDNIQPATAGTPVEVQASINSVPYRLLIERVQRNRQFAQERINVSGRGLAAILDAPYAPVMDFGNPADARSAQQLMGDVLTINSVSMGWAIDFGLTDWTVPAGAWQHAGTYISALNAIAQAAGGYLQPHATAQTLRVLHRYPLAPWDWSALTPDIELPLAATSVEGVEWVKKPAYNRVYVSGADGSGILGQVSIAGTPGDEPAPMVTDALITHLEAARQRGRTILSDTGPQALVSLTLPVLPETGLILPGQFVRRTDGAASVQGYVRSMQLQWDRPRMRQTIEVQTHA